MYAKLFARITESSLMEEPVETRYTFLLLLAIAGPDGVVVGTDIALARRLNIPIETFRAAIDRLMAPDPDSNSPAEEGRRVLRSEGERGYQLVNFMHYSRIRDENQRREYMRTYIAEYRRAGRDKSTAVNSVNPGKPELAHTDTDTDVHTDTEGERALGQSPNGASRFAPPKPDEVLAEAKLIELPESEVEMFFNFYSSNGWRVGRSPMKSWRAALRTWKMRWQKDGTKTPGRMLSVPLPAQLRALEEQIAEAARAGYEDGPFGLKFTNPQDAERHLELLRKRKALTRQIADGGAA
jgi:hypothetical protein